MSAAGPLVADTHTFVWYAGRSPRLSECARDALNAVTEANFPIFVSAMSVVELRYLVEKGTISEAEFEVLVSELEKSDSPYEIAPLDAGIALEVGQITRKHNADPFDRTIGATAISLGIPLVTSDRKLREQPVLETVW